MSTLSAPKKISKRQELREDTVVTAYAKSWAFVDQNKSLVIGAAVGVLVLIVAAFGWGFYQASQESAAQDRFAEALRLYEAGDYQVALSGTETSIGLLEVANAYGGTDAGNLAQFYVADAYFQLGDMDSALEYFQAYDKGDDIVGASAYAGEAAIYEAQGDFEAAGEHYLSAAAAYDNDAFAPDYLVKAGLAFETAGAFPKAISAFETIQDDYPDAVQRTNVEVLLARVKAKQ